MRIGAINWDAVLPSNTYFGGFTTRNLGNEKHKTRLHYLAVENNGKYDFPCRTQSDYYRELQYAIDGGIDFFAYCWYPDSDEERNICPENEEYEYLAPHYHELNAARKLYQTSELNKKINMCAILLTCNAYAKSDIDSLADAMKESYYEKIDGKPIVVIFGGYKEKFVKLIKGMLKEKGITPYVAVVDSDGRNNFNLQKGDADAITSYACFGSGDKFSELNKICYEQNCGRLHYELPVIPLMTAGWNPMPRIDNPSPWIAYKNVAYPTVPEFDDMKESFSLLYKFISENSQYANTDHALIFAWNEFEEGGYLCPTLNEDGTVNDSVIRNFAKAKKLYLSE